MIFEVLTSSDALWFMILGDRKLLFLKVWSRATCTRGDGQWRGEEAGRGENHMTSKAKSWKTLLPDLWEHSLSKS